MDISLNTNLNTNRTTAVSFTDMQEVIAEKSDQLKGGGIRGPSLTVTERQLSGLEALDDNMDIELDRNDALGKLVMSAFELKAPEAPEFI